eukprot:UN05928
MSSNLMYSSMSSHASQHSSSIVVLLAGSWPVSTAKSVTPTANPSVCTSGGSSAFSQYPREPAPPQTLDVAPERVTDFAARPWRIPCRSGMRGALRRGGCW